jgi:hypothetical protein
MIPFTIDTPKLETCETGAEKVCNECNTRLPEGGMFKVGITYEPEQTITKHVCCIRCLSHLLASIEA